MADPAVYEQSERGGVSVEAVLQFLQKHGLKDAESAFVKEAQPLISESQLSRSVDGELSRDDQVGISAPLAHKGGDVHPLAYTHEYEALLAFIDNSLDRLKAELALLLYPVFAHMYLELVLSEQAEPAAAFMGRFGQKQEESWSADVATLRHVTTADQCASNEYVAALSKKPYVVRMSRTCLAPLKPFLQQRPLLHAIMKHHMSIEQSDEAPRSKRALEAVVGGVLGEAPKSENKARVMCGLQRDAVAPVDDLGDESSAKKRRAKVKEARDAKSKRGDPSVPPANRVPLPDWPEAIKAERLQLLKDINKCYKISSEHPPSVCFYTVTNSRSGVSCCAVSDDSSMLICGFENSELKVWPIGQNKLAALKSASELESVDLDSDTILTDLLDETGHQVETLSGHCGPVFGTTLSPDRRLAASASEDATIRLWSLQTWTNVTSASVGGYPVWDVAFCPRGYYFASGGADRLAMLWATDVVQPIRLFAGHFADVHCVAFHPNCNYVVSGGADRSVRLWDVTSGSCVRHLTGHKEALMAVRVSPNGRYVASAAANGAVLVWDVASSQLVAQHTPTAAQRAPVYAIEFSRDGGVLAVGGGDNHVRLLNLEAAISSASDAISDSQIDIADANYDLEMYRFLTKSTPVVGLHFTSKNLLVGVGAYGQE